MSVSNWHVCRTAQRESAEPESPAPTILRPDLAGYSKEPTRVRSQPTCDSFSGDTRTRVAFFYNCHSLLVVAREQRRPSGDVAAICVATVGGVGSAPAAAVVGLAPAATQSGVAAAVVRLTPAPSGTGSYCSARRGGSDACAVSQSSVSHSAISGAVSHSSVSHATACNANSTTSDTCRANPSARTGTATTVSERVIRNEGHPHKQGGCETYKDSTHHWCSSSHVPADKYGESRSRAKA